jgi:DNA-binding NarL/FixJ family response regulator
LQSDQTGGTNMTRILVADEHALYRTGLRTILQAALPEAEFLEAADFDGLMRSLMEEQPLHLVLVSLNLTGSSDPQIIWDFKRASTTTRYVIILGQRYLRSGPPLHRRRIPRLHLETAAG